MYIFLKFILLLSLEEAQFQNSSSIYINTTKEPETLFICEIWKLWEFADNEMLKKFPPDSTQQQALITPIQNDDGYNWGYANPFCHL